MQYVTALDIGSQSIKVLVAEVKKGGKLSLILATKLPSGGVKRGIVDDLAEATYAVNNALGEVRKISKIAVKNIYLGVGGPDVRVQSSTGSVAVSRADNEISQEDVDRAVEASRAVRLSLNRMIMHSITREFVVDGVSDIKDALGMVGNKLEVNSLIIDDFAPAVKNLTKCVEISGGSISGLILSPLAAARAVLNRNQKDLGVVLVDIGFSKTGISIYQENKLLHTAIFSVGSGNITNDLAIGLRNAVATAEIIKLSFGSALSKDISRRETIDLQKIDAAARGVVSRKFVSEIIESRLAEIFEFVNNELKRFGKNIQFPSGIVLVGGGAKLPSIADLARQELKLPSQLGVPDLSSLAVINGELGLQVEDPEFATAAGLLIWGSEKFVQPPSTNPSFAKLVKKLIGYFMP